jgi:hypothetical protein
MAGREATSRDRPEPTDHPDTDKAGPATRKADRPAMGRTGPRTGSADPAMGRTGPAMGRTGPHTGRTGPGTVRHTDLAHLLDLARLLDRAHLLDRVRLTDRAGRRLGSSLGPGRRAGDCLTPRYQVVPPQRAGVCDGSGRGRHWRQEPPGSRSSACWPDTSSAIRPRRTTPRSSPAAPGIAASTRRRSPRQRRSPAEASSSPRTCRTRSTSTATLPTVTLPPWDYSCARPGNRRSRFRRWWRSRRSRCLTHRPVTRSRWSGSPKRTCVRKNSPLRPSATL